MQVQLRIHEEGLLLNQHHAFTDRFTLVTELLQNARRAGATRISVTHDEAAELLRVVDDGSGVDDFQNLLTFYMSGWDERTRARDHPYGIGFSKCLYASSRCIVSSLRHRIDVDTRRVLARDPVEVVQLPGDGSACDRGTSVELHGVALPGLAGHIESLCLGFPVEVEFNETLVARPFAEANLQTMPSSIGSVHLAEINDETGANGVLVFLQGMCVLRPHWLGGSTDVIHLDPRLFMARLPDRDRLIDEDVQRQRILTEIRACWRTRLLIERRELSAEAFVDRYYATLRAWNHLDLLNELDIVPRSICQSIGGYPIQEVGFDLSHLAPVIAHPTRAEVEGGTLLLADLGPVDEENAACWMLARAKGYVVVDIFGLDVGHWLHPLLVRLEGQPISVEAVGETHRTRLEGNWITPELVLSGSVRIQVGTEVAEVHDAGVFHDDCLYIPAGEATGEPVRQVSTYTDGNDQFLETDLEIDRRLLEEQIRRLRAVDPAHLLDAMLGPLSLGRYPLLHGRSFLLSVGLGGAPGYSVAEAERTSEGEEDDPHAER